MDSITVAQAILHRVVAKLGDAAASQLGVTQAAFALFLNGTQALPDRVLLRAVDIVLDEPLYIGSAESCGILGRKGVRERTDHQTPSNVQSEDAA